MWIDLLLSPLPLNVQNAGVHGSTVFKRLSNRALAAVGGKCWCGPSGRSDLIELRTGAFQSKSDSAQRNTSIQHFGRIRTRRQTAEGNPKTMGFWRRSFPHFFRCRKKWSLRRQIRGSPETNRFQAALHKKRESLRWSKALFHYSLPSGILAIIVLYTCRKNSSVRVSENTSAMG